MSLGSGLTMDYTDDCRMEIHPSGSYFPSKRNQSSVIITKSLAVSEGIILLAPSVAGKFLCAVKQAPLAHLGAMLGPHQRKRRL